MPNTYTISAGKKRSVSQILMENGQLREVLWFNAPKSFVVIGNLSELNTNLGVNEGKFSSFELFRNELRRPEIITFDELYERARYIVEHAALNTVGD